MGELAVVDAQDLGAGRAVEDAVGARELVTEPRLLCVDEPTAGMDDEQAGPILELLRSEGRHRTILFVTHNQSHARQCTDFVILLADGQLQEYRTTADFFGSPASKSARDYVRTGSCYVAVDRKSVV